MPPVSDERRRGSRLGRFTATFIEQVAGQHGKRVDGQTLVVPQCMWVPSGQPTETQQQNRAATETTSTLYVPRGLPDMADWVCTLAPGPQNDDGTPTRIAVVGEPKPYWRRNGSFSHSEVSLRESTS